MPMESVCYSKLSEFVPFTETQKSNTAIRQFSSQMILSTPPKNYGKKANSEWPLITSSSPSSLKFIWNSTQKGRNVTLETLWIYHDRDVADVYVHALKLFKQITEFLFASIQDYLCLV